MTPIELTKPQLMRHLRASHGDIFPPDAELHISIVGEVLRIEQIDPAATPETGVKMDEDFGEPDEEKKPARRRH